MTTNELHARLIATMDKRLKFYPHADSIIGYGHGANVGGKMYLTDGFLAIRFASDEGRPMDTSTAANLAWPADGDREFAKPWPTDPKRTGERKPCNHKCENCNGTGEDVCPYCDRGGKCDDCDGVGTWAEDACPLCSGTGDRGDEKIVLCGCTFGTRLHDLILSLPGACYLEVLPPENVLGSHKIAGFFDGGEFLLACTIEKEPK